MRSIYFDYNATTPLDGGVRNAMIPFFDGFYGNPSSVHHIGREARSLLDDARDRVARVWACKPSEVIFTSGGTESNNLAIFGSARFLKDRGRHLVTSAVEHHAVLHPCEYLADKEGFDLSVIPVDADGIVDVNAVKNALREDTILVSVMAANNETGSLQPVAEIGRFCRERGILFHTDAVQSVGKLPFESIHQFEADLVSVCGHKFHGPKGAGALFIRSPFFPDPILFGGSHENERRAGTENLAAVIGFAEACERFIRKPVFDPVAMQPLANRILTVIDSLEGVDFRGSRELRLPNTVAFSVTGSDSIAVLAALDLEGICASSGSACTSGSVTPSHVLKAMGVPAADANALVRFSLGRESSSSEVDRIIEVLPDLLSRLRKTPVRH